MATKTWDGFGNWTDAADWNPTGVPGGGDDVSDSSGSLLVSTTVGSVRSLSVSSTNALTISSGGYLPVGGTVALTSGISLGGRLSASAITTARASSGISEAGTASAPAELDITGPAGLGMVGSVSGTFNISGYSVVQFSSGRLTSVSATGVLGITGPNAFVGGAGSNAGITGIAENAGTLGFANGATAELEGEVENSGFLNVDGGYMQGGSSLRVDGTLTNTRVVTVGNQQTSANSSLILGALNNSGTVTIAGYGSVTASLIVQGQTIGGGTINVTAASLELGSASSNVINLPGPGFSNMGGGGHGLIKLDAPASFTGTITGFGSSSGDTLDLVGELATIQSYDGSTLVVQVGASTQSFALSGPMAGSLRAVSDGAGGTDVIVCFTTGTLIRTARGEVAVEALRVGDLAVTASGDLRPVTWIGHRTLAHLSPNHAPVRIRASAFGSNLPIRDLALSPGHLVLVGADEDGGGGVLVPIMCLINGTTIERTAAERVTYWHVELDTHDILLAEGLAAESYHDGGSRPWFAGEDDALRDPDFVAPGLAGRCRPVAIDGPVVEAERRRLDAMFAGHLDAMCGWPTDDAASLSP